MSGLEAMNDAGHVLAKFSCVATRQRCAAFIDLVIMAGAATRSLALSVLTAVAAEYGNVKPERMTPLES